LTGKTSAKNATDRGKNALGAWLEAQPTNYFLADDGLARALEMHLGQEAFEAFRPQLEEFGKAMADVDAAVRENNLHRNLPRLETRDGIGRVIDEVVHHPSYHVVGRAIYEGGAMHALGDAEFPNTRALALFYLSSLNGEAGHNCPLACTAGLIKILQYVADPEIRERFLERLLIPDYDKHLHGAQFLTEIQGGSDVGANATVASPDPDEDGAYRIRGEKWFCSNIGGDITLMTARIDGAEEGTRGLGLFLVPLRNEDGSPNGYRVWRLKDKIGTRSMASGEINLEGAKAYHMGPVSEGFRNMMRYVIHSSRIYNALSSVGGMRRATITAWTYAQHREAFGNTIGNYPLVQEVLADMRSDTAAVRATCFHLLKIQDELERGFGGDESEQAAQRMAVNLNKTMAARLAHNVCNQGIEVLGGNGAIESFSVLPRLLRDNIVSENWEGTHNTLFLQFLRDAKSRNMDRPLYARISKLFASIETSGNAFLEKLSREGQAAAQLEQSACEAMKDMPLELATLEAKTRCDQACFLLYAACLGHEASFSLSKEREDAQDALNLTQHFWDRHLGSSPYRNTPGYLERLGAIAARC